MSDLDNMKRILDAFRKDAYKEEVTDFGYELVVERGYSGFYVLMQFDHSGKLMDIGAYE